MKKTLHNDLLLYPCPVLLVTSKYNETQNVFTVSWSGIACSHPEYLAISIKPSRYSYSIIKNSGYFAVNIVNKQLLSVANYCGVHSGRDYNKFKECNLTTLQAGIIDVPIIKECPINIECKVEKIIELGSHDLFVGRVLNKVIDSDIRCDDMHAVLEPVCYFRPNFYALDKDCLGTYGQLTSELSLH